MKFLHKTGAIILVNLIALCVNETIAQSRIKFTLPFGKWSVGFNSVNLYDSSRSVPLVDSIGERIIPSPPRPLQVSIWYPTMASPTAKFMKYRDYVGLFSKPLRLPELTPQGRKQGENDFLTYDIFLGLSKPRSGLPWRTWQDSALAHLKALASREFDVKTHAVLNAAHAAGTFPVLIYAPGAYGPSFENDILMEYLASHGYIVVASPNWGPTGLTQADRIGLELQARDIEFLIGYGRRVQSASKGPVGIIGFSWGGISNVVVASRNNSVGAIVTLDGTIRYFSTKDYVKQALTQGLFYTTPTLFLDQGANKDTAFFARHEGDMENLFFNDLKFADAYQLKMKTIDHQNFVALFNRFSGPQPINYIYDTAIFNPAYDRICLYTLKFLNAYLKKDSLSKQFLQTDPDKLGIPTSDVVMQRKYGLRPLPTIASFANAVKSVGTSHALEFFREVKSTNPEYTLPERDLSRWGWDLGGHDAIAVFKLRAELYPKSPTSFNDLGDAYLATGETAQAIQNFEHSLMLDPKNTYAQKMLKQLKKE